MDVDIVDVAASAAVTASATAMTAATSSAAVTAPATRLLRAAMAKRGDVPEWLEKDFNWWLSMERVRTNEPSVHTVRFYLRLIDKGTVADQVKWTCIWARSWPKLWMRLHEVFLKRKKDAAKKKAADRRRLRQSSSRGKAGCKRFTRHRTPVPPAAGHDL